MSIACPRSVGAPREQRIHTLPPGEREVDRVAEEVAEDVRDLVAIRVE